MIAAQGRRSLLGGLGSLAFASAARGQGALQDLAVPIPSVSFVTASVRAAQQLGLFARRGIAARTITMDSANSVTSAVIAGSASVGLSGPGELVAAWARGQKVVAIAEAYRGLGASLVLSTEAARRTGIAPSAASAERIKALGGLLIASPSATSSYTASYKGAAEAAGVRIRFTYMAQPAMAAALATGAVQGMISGAPFWGPPVARGDGVLWLSGPRGELPAANMPASSASLQAMLPFAEANAPLMRHLADAMAEFGRLVVTEPAQVKMALSRLYPDVDSPTMDVLFEGESQAWRSPPLTAADMRHEIDFIRSGGAPIPGLDRLDPAAMLFPPPT